MPPGFARHASARFNLICSVGQECVLGRADLTSSFLPAAFRAIRLTSVTSRSPPTYIKTHVDWFAAF
jgi:hypothetical protein